MARLSLKIKGKPVNFEVGILAFRLYCEHHGIGLGNLGEHMQKKAEWAIVDLLYFGHEAYCRLNDKSNDESLDSATLWLEELKPSEFEKITAAINDTKLFGEKLSAMSKKKPEATELTKK